MSLDGAKLVSLNGDGARGVEYLAKGRKFAVGNYVNCDYVPDDTRAKGVHCEINCDSFGRVTIHNFSDEHPISLNGRIVDSGKRPLLNGTYITILDKQYLWEFPRNEPSESTPEKQKGVPEQPPTSCPDLGEKRRVATRMTFHNFAYCIQSDELGNSSLEANESKLNDSNTNEVELSMGEPEKTEISQRRSTTPENNDASQNNQLVETPKINLLDSTKNKENTSTKKKLQLLSLCEKSDILITSYSPRTTGVCIEKSFTKLIKPNELTAESTPRSEYSTPKSVLSESHNSRDFMDFSTPTTSKKAKNSSMYLIDLTTPSRMRPVSKAENSLAKNTPATIANATTHTPGSSSSVFSVDSSGSSVIEISSSNTPDSPSSAQRSMKTPSKLLAAGTPKRTPQSLMKRALLTSAKKHATARRLHQSPITPKNVSVKSAIELARRQSLTTPTRKFQRTEKVTLDQKNALSVRRSLIMVNESRKIALRTPISATSTSLLNNTANDNSPQEHSERKLSTATSQFREFTAGVRKSLASPRRLSPTHLSNKLVNKARKSFCTPQLSPMSARARALSYAATNTPASILKRRQSASKLPKTPTAHENENKRAVLFNESTKKESEETQQDDLSLTFIVDNSLDEVNESVEINDDAKLSTKPEENISILPEENPNTSKNSESILEINENSNDATELLLSKIDQVLNKSDELEKSKCVNEDTSEDQQIPNTDTSLTEESCIEKSKNLLESGELQRVVEEDLGQKVESSKKELSKPIELSITDTEGTTDKPEEDNKEATKLASSSLASLQKLKDSESNNDLDESLNVEQVNIVTEGNHDVCSIIEELKVQEEEVTENLDNSDESIGDKVDITEKEAESEREIRENKLQLRLDNNGIVSDENTAIACSNNIKDKESATDNSLLNKTIEVNEEEIGIEEVNVRVEEDSKSDKEVSESNQQSLSIPNELSSDGNALLEDVLNVNEIEADRNTTEKKVEEISNSADNTTVDLQRTMRQASPSKTDIIDSPAGSVNKTLNENAEEVLSVDEVNSSGMEKTELLPRTPRRSTRRASMSSVSQITTPRSTKKVDASFTPTRKTRRASLSASTSNTETTRTHPMTRRSSLSAMPLDGKCPVTPRSVSKRRSSDDNMSTFKTTTPKKPNLIDETIGDMCVIVEEDDNDAVDAAELHKESKDNTLNKHIVHGLPSTSVVEEGICEEIDGNKPVTAEAEENLPPVENQKPPKALELLGEDYGIEVFPTQANDGIKDRDNDDKNTTPRSKKSNEELESKIDYQGMREMLKTPISCSTPRLKGIREMLKTPKTCDSPKLSGIRELVNTPKNIATNSHINIALAEVTRESSLNQNYDEGLDKFFKTPRSKNIMMPNDPASAVLNSSNAQGLERVQTTECELNATNASIQLEKLFETPVAKSRFASHLSDDDDNNVEDVHEESQTAKTSKAEAPHEGSPKRNLSAEEAFDELIGQSSTFQTPVDKVYHRKSQMASQPSPFSSVDVITDLPKTDIQEWVDNLEEAENNDATFNKTENELSLTVVSDQDEDPLHTSRTPDVESQKAKSFSKINVTANEVNDTIASENLMDVSTVSSLHDPLSSTVSKANETVTNSTNLYTKEPTNEINQSRPTTPTELDMSGLQPLDETSESVMEPLVVSFADSLDDTLEETEPAYLKQPAASENEKLCDETLAHNLTVDNNIKEASIVSENEVALSVDDDMFDKDINPENTLKELPQANESIKAINLVNESNNVTDPSISEDINNEVHNNEESKDFNASTIMNPEQDQVETGNKESESTNITLATVEKGLHETSCNKDLIEPTNEVNESIECLETESIQSTESEKNIDDLEICANKSNIEVESNEAVKADSSRCIDDSENFLKSDETNSDDIISTTISAEIDQESGNDKEKVLTSDTSIIKENNEVVKSDDDDDHDNGGENVKVVTVETAVVSIGTTDCVNVESIETRLTPSTQELEEPVEVGKISETELHEIVEPNNKENVTESMESCDERRQSNTENKIDCSLDNQTSADSNAESECEASNNIESDTSSTPNIIPELKESEVLSQPSTSDVASRKTNENKNESSVLTDETANIEKLNSELEESSMSINEKTDSKIVDGNEKVLATVDDTITNSSHIETKKIDEDSEFILSEGDELKAIIEDTVDQSSSTEADVLPSSSIESVLSSDSNEGNLINKNSKVEDKNDFESVSNQTVDQNEDVFQAKSASSEINTEVINIQDSSESSLSEGDKLNLTIEEKVELSRVEKAAFDECPKDEDKNNFASVSNKTVDQIEDILQTKSTTCEINTEKEIIEDSSESTLSEVDKLIATIEDKADLSSVEKTAFDESPKDEVELVSESVSNETVNQIEDVLQTKSSSCKIITEVINIQDSSESTLSEGDKLNAISEDNADLSSLERAAFDKSPKDEEKNHFASVSNKAVDHIEDVLQTKSATREIDTEEEIIEDSSESTLSENDKLNASIKDKADLSTVEKTAFDECLKDEDLSNETVDQIEDVPQSKSGTCEINTEEQNIEESSNLNPIYSHEDEQTETTTDQNLTDIISTKAGHDTDGSEDVISVASDKALDNNGSNDTEIDSVSGSIKEVMVTPTEIEEKTDQTSEKIESSIDSTEHVVVIPTTETIVQASKESVDDEIVNDNLKDSFNADNDIKVINNGASAPTEHTIELSPKKKISDEISLPIEPNTSQCNIASNTVEELETLTTSDSLPITQTNIQIDQIKSKGEEVLEPEVEVATCSSKTVEETIEIDSDDNDDSNLTTENIVSKNKKQITVVGNYEITLEQSQENKQQDSDDDTNFKKKIIHTTVLTEQANRKTSRTPTVEIIEISSSSETFSEKISSVAVKDTMATSGKTRSCSELKEKVSLSISTDHFDTASVSSDETNLQCTQHAAKSSLKGIDEEDEEISETPAKVQDVLRKRGCRDVSKDGSKHVWQQRKPSVSVETGNTLVEQPTKFEPTNDVKHILTESADQKLSPKPSSDKPNEKKEKSPVSSLEIAQKRKPSVSVETEIDLVEQPTKATAEIFEPTNEVTESADEKLAPKARKASSDEVYEKKVTTPVTSSESTQEMVAKHPTRRRGRVPSVSEEAKNIIIKDKKDQDEITHKKPVRRGAKVAILVEEPISMDKKTPDGNALPEPTVAALTVTEPKAESKVTNKPTVRRGRKGSVSVEQAVIDHQEISSAVEETEKKRPTRRGRKGSALNEPTSEDAPEKAIATETAIEEQQKPSRRRRKSSENKDLTEAKTIENPTLKKTRRGREASTPKVEASVSIHKLEDTIVFTPIAAEVSSNKPAKRTRKAIKELTKNDLAEDVEVKETSKLSEQKEAGNSKPVRRGRRQVVEPTTEPTVVEVVKEDTQTNINVSANSNQSVKRDQKSRTPENSPDRLNLTSTEELNSLKRESRNIPRHNYDETSEDETPTKSTGNRSRRVRKVEPTKQTTPVQAQASTFQPPPVIGIEEVETVHPEPLAAETTDDMSPSKRGGRNIPRRNYDETSDDEKVEGSATSRTRRTRKPTTKALLLEIERAATPKRQRVLQDVVETGTPKRQTPIRKRAGRKAKTDLSEEPPLKKLTPSPSEVSTNKNDELPTTSLNVASEQSGEDQTSNKPLATKTRGRRKVMKPTETLESTEEEKKVTSPLQVAERKEEQHMKTSPIPPTATVGRAKRAGRAAANKKATDAETVDTAAEKLQDENISASPLGQNVDVDGKPTIKATRSRGERKTKATKNDDGEDAGEPVSKKALTTRVRAAKKQKSDEVVLGDEIEDEKPQLPKSSGRGRKASAESVSTVAPRKGRGKQQMDVVAITEDHEEQHEPVEQKVSATTNKRGRGKTTAPAAAHETEDQSAASEAPPPPTRTVRGRKVHFEATDSSVKSATDAIDAPEPKRATRSRRK